MATNLNNTYLFINKRGDCNYTLAASWKVVLSNYIDSNVGYDAGLKFNKQTWDAITNKLTDDSKLIKFFNSACGVKSLRIKTVLCDHSLSFPEACIKDNESFAKIVIIDKLGNCHEYGYESADDTYIADYLDEYIKDTAGYCAGFSLDRETWLSVNAAINELEQVSTERKAYRDSVRINTFNTLCKKKKYQIAAVLLDPLTMFSDT